MPSDQPDRAERLQEILSDLINKVHSFLQFSKEREIARTDEWRDLSTANDKAANDLSNLRSERRSPSVGAT
jgi:hypothetical protein